MFKLQLISLNLSQVTNNIPERKTIMLNIIYLDVSSP